VPLATEALDVAIAKERKKRQEKRQGKRQEKKAGGRRKGKKAQGRKAPTTGQAVDAPALAVRWWLLQGEMLGMWGPVSPSSGA